MKYLLSFVSTACAIFLGVATLNWTTDPAGLFSTNSFGKQFASRLVSSENGLLLPDSVDEREFKRFLASMPSSADCIVIGSSHVMEIGSARRHRSFPECRQILNLGVSGAGIEDLYVLTWLSLKSNQPKTLILEIAPWTLAFGKDARWNVRYPEDYDTALSSIGSGQAASTTVEKQSRWSTLISAQYARRSLAAIRQRDTSHAIVPAPPTDEDTGGQLPVILSDGSLIYSAEYLANSKKSAVPLGGSDYKNSAPTNEARALHAFEQLVLWVRAQGIHPVLLLTPYQHNVWRLENATTVQLMKETEKLAIEIGIKLEMPVVGSYRPERAGCLPDEFYDFMHPNAKCLARMTGSTERAANPAPGYPNG